MSESQAEANRKNGELGGVKTEEGKQVSRMNACGAPKKLDRGIR